MPSEKTKKLLEGLGKITDSAPKPFEHQKYHSYTNRFYENLIHKLPTIYDKAKRKKDDEGDEYKAPAPGKFFSIQASKFSICVSLANPRPFSEFDCFRC